MPARSSCSGLSTRDIVLPMGPPDAAGDEGNSVSDSIEFAGPYGQMTPCGGGDPIPLMKDRLTIGRRAECDIQLRFANVSGQHCRLTLEYGYWFVRDLKRPKRRQS